MDLLEAARTHGNPIIQGARVTVIWVGKSAPEFISDLHGWESNPQSLVKLKMGLWGISFELPLDAYLEYAFIDPATKKHIPDPLNRKKVFNGVVGYNQYFYMPDAQPTDLAFLPPGGMRGKVTRHLVPSRYLTISNSRLVYLYHPPVRKAVPLLMVYDGLDYLRRGKLAAIVDNLIAARRIGPLAIAFCQHGGPGRMVEYDCSDATLEFLISQVLPLAGSQIKLLDYKKQPGVHGVMGASMGGLMSVYSALRLPEVFGRALSQAGAFELGPGESLIRQMVRLLPRPAVRLWLDCGRLDSLLESNRRFRDLLTEKRYDLVYRENGGAHNYTTWRNSFPQGLEALF